MNNNEDFHGFKDSKLTIYKDENGNDIRPYVTTLFCRRDMMRDGSNNDIWSNWAPSPEAACSYPMTSTIAKQFILSLQSIGPCQYGHEIMMLTKY